MRPLGAVLALAVAVAAERTQAQSPAEVSAARALFEQGLAAAREERWEDARAAFERSLAIVERPSTLLNLAGAQAQTGRLVEAAASYRRFLEIATAREARLRPEAERALRAIEARLPRVTIEAPGATPQDEVTLDGRAVELHERIAVDPGRHTVVAIRGGDEIARRELTLAEGASETVVLTLRAEVVPDAARTQAASQGGDDTALWIGLGVGAAVVVGVAVGVGIALGTAEPAYYQGTIGDGTIRF